MKKLVITLAIISMGVLSAQGVWNRDVAQLQQDLSQAAETDINTRVTLTGAIALLQTPPQNINDVAAVFATVVNSVCDDQWTEASKTDLAHTKVKQYLLAKKLWPAELLTYCQANPNHYDINILELCRGTAWARERAANLIMEARLTPAQALKALSLLVTANINGEITDENMKELLRKMDLRYTDLLSSNKEEWSPVVAKIRTLLDRYK